MISSRFSIRLVTACLVAATFTACGGGAPVDPEAVGIGGRNGRTARDVQGEMNFATLINKYPVGQPEKTPWAGSWWPYKENGIASNRGAHGSSPAGKYDAARGDRGNAAQSWEAKNHGSGVKGIQGWWGHCNGWSVAAALFAEPNQPKTVNGITFGIADIKGLLTEIGLSADADYFGNRVDHPEDYNTPKYWDTIPNEYFLVLTNYMGNYKKPVLIDRYTGDQIWNQPLVGYRFDKPKPEDYKGPSPDAPGIYRMVVRSQMFWANDGVAADTVTPPFDMNDAQFNVDDAGIYYQARHLTMELWLDGPVVFDAQGNVKSSGNLVVTHDPDHPEYHVGGSWSHGAYSVDAHPDYMWIPYAYAQPDPNDKDPYANPMIDPDWVIKHVVAGVDDPSYHPVPVPTAPSPLPMPSDHPNPAPSAQPAPTPTHTTTPRPHRWF